MIRGTAFFSQEEWCLMRASQRSSGHRAISHKDGIRFASCGTPQSNVLTVRHALYEGVQCSIHQLCVNDRDYSAAASGCPHSSKIILSVWAGKTAFLFCAGFGCENNSS